MAHRPVASNFLPAGARPWLNLSAVLLLHRLFQLLNVANHWSDVQTERARVYTLLVLAAAALGAASTVALPARFYLRHRCATLRHMGAGLLRPANASILKRTYQPRAGDAQHVCALP